MATMCRAIAEMAERAVGEAGAGVAGAPGRLDAEAGDGVAAGGDLVAGAAGLGHQDDGVAAGLGLDEVAGGGGADLLVGGEEDGDGQAWSRCRLRASWRSASSTSRLPPFMS